MAEQDVAADTMTATLAGVLGNTTGILLSDLGEMYAVQDFLVGRPLMTHERIDPSNDVAALLLAQFPLLAEADPPPLKRASVRETQDACTAWVWSVAAHTGYPMQLEVRRADATAETDDAVKAAFLAETDEDRRWELLESLHQRGWAYRPFNQAEPFAPRRDYSPGAGQ